MTRTADIAVVGAGPAGCVLAIRMVQLGFDVCLVERAEFPRAHLGESLSPGVRPLLASVGAGDVFDASGAQGVVAVSTNWEGHEDVRHDPRAEGMLVDRGAFDAALLARARAVGVRVMQPARLRAHEATADGWRLLIDDRGAPRELRAKFLADATGRAARLGGRRRAMGPRTLALYAYWTGTRLPDRPRIEAGAGAWYWGVPIPDGSYNTLVFVDSAQARTVPGETMNDRLRALLARSALMAQVRGATLRGRVQAADATAYVDETCVGDRLLRVGDAALALDPLSSSGVQKALQTALAGAIVANTLLRRPEAGAAAQQFYRDSLTGAAARHQAWAAGHYATAAARWRDPFWIARAGVGTPAEQDPNLTIPDDMPVQLSPHARWDDVPCLGAQFVEVRPALRHPGLDGAVAYVGGRELAPLLRDMRPGMSARQMANAWAPALPVGTGLTIARWLTAHGVLERCGTLHE